MCKNILKVGLIFVYLNQSHLFLEEDEPKVSFINMKLALKAQVKNLKTQ